MSRLANYRPRRGENNPAKTRAHATHVMNPPGSKRVRRNFKEKHEYRANAPTAHRWYAGYLAEADAKVRRIEAQRRAHRQERSMRMRRAA